MDEYSEVSVLIKAASEAACPSKLLCSFHAEESRNFCIDCGLPTRYVAKEKLTWTVARATVLGAWILFVLNFLDLTTTAVGLNNGFRETNPLAADMIEQFPWGAIAIKLIFGFVLLWTFGRKYIDAAVNLYALCAVWFLCGIYGFVVISNFGLFFEG